MTKIMDVASMVADRFREVTRNLEQVARDAEKDAPLVRVGDLPEYKAAVQALYTLQRAYADKLSRDMGSRLHP